MFPNGKYIYGIARVYVRVVISVVTISIVGMLFNIYPWIWNWLVLGVLSGSAVSIIPIVLNGNFAARPATGGTFNADSIAAVALRQSLESSENIIERSRLRYFEPKRFTEWWFGAPKALLRGFFALFAAIADVLGIILGAVLSGLILIVFTGANDSIDLFIRIGLALSIIFVIANVVRDHYVAGNYLNIIELVRKTFVIWNVVVAFALLFATVTGTSFTFSRLYVVLFYFFGLTLLSIIRVVLIFFVRANASAGAISLRRVLLVGFETAVEEFAARYTSPESGMHVVAAVVLRGTDTLEEDLALAAASARMIRPDDVFILASWSDKKITDACVSAFMRVPVSISVESEAPALKLMRRPLSFGEVALKRTVDVLLASAGLAILSPLFLLVAVAIKLDSRGPVFFLQRRYGFNREPFHIYKFRSMTTMDDRRHVPQAQAGDPRITRVGRFMRRTNIDELPQLFNVLSGEMSLVGPRPHALALAHDQMYEQTIAFYARRHNVKPGITGLAQVYGLRGDTTTEDKMRARVEHDLWYIDNWSLMLDLRILALTLFSRKAYRNAV